MAGANEAPALEAGGLERERGGGRQAGRATPGP
jgi:hypothetical protein